MDMRTEEERGLVRYRATKERPIVPAPTIATWCCCASTISCGLKEVSLVEAVVESKLVVIIRYCGGIVVE